MNKGNWDDFCDLCHMVSEITNTAKKSDNAVTFMFGILGKYDFEAIKNAFMAHIKTARFFPTPAEIIQQIDGTPDERSRAAWWKLLNAAKNYGGYSTVQFDDPKIHFAIQKIGGWQELCATYEDELKWKEKEFYKHYTDAEKFDVTWNSDVPKMLIGITDGDNMCKGYLEKPTPIRIGEPERFLELDTPKPKQLNYANIVKSMD